MTHSPLNFDRKTRMTENEKNTRLEPDLPNARLNFYLVGRVYITLCKCQPSGEMDGSYECKPRRDQSEAISSGVLALADSYGAGSGGQHMNMSDTPRPLSLTAWGAGVFPRECENIPRLSASTGRDATLRKINVDTLDTLSLLECF